MADSNETEWQDITLRVPKSIDLSGFEKVAEFRSPEAGEPFLSSEPGVIKCKMKYNSDDCRVVFTPHPPPYQWPKLADGTPIGGWGFACDADGVYWYCEEPTHHADGSFSSSARMVYFKDIERLNIPVPPLKPGEVCKNPHYQAKGGE